MKCLNKRADDRYQSCEVLARELKTFLASPSTPVKKAAKSPDPALPAGPAVVLEVEETGRQFRLKKPVSLVGRGPECDLVIKKADVSKRHCRILLRPDGAEVEDLDSSTGTAVNGDLVRQHALEDGDRLEVGRYAFRVRLELKPEKE
jgi:pSer/pThr/pTyr-binding forkhead associated (FHA) protein